MAKKVIKKKKKKKPNNKSPVKVNAEPTQPESAPVKSKGLQFKEVFIALVKSLGPDANDQDKEKRNHLLKEYLKNLYVEYTISDKYNVVIFYDEGSMVRSDINRIYSAITGFKQQKPILLMLYSTGGDVDSGYLIGKLCREYCKDKFVVVIPRRAKSSATLLSCAADELHMGSLSELGPIDPQVEYMPALGLKDSVETLAELVKDHPEAADMFAKYLHQSLKPMHLGYCERVAESASHYAQRLLKTHMKDLNNSPFEIAQRLVYSYKDHGFVIDKTEAKDIFGPKIVKENTPEYGFGNAIYGALWRIGDVVNRMNRKFCLIGTYNTKPIFWQK